ncbi:MAG: phosphatase PAP2 family protein [Acidimicrobiales bacterium]
MKPTDEYKVADVAESNEFLRPSRHRRKTAAYRRRRLVGGYLAASALWVVFVGLPVERVVVLLWLFGLLATSIATEGTDRLKSLARDWGLFAVLLIAYRYSAGLADGVGRPVAMNGLASIDRTIGLGEIPTVRLQSQFDQTGQAPLWQVPLSFVYISHFFGILVAGAALWFRDRPAWVGYTKRLLTLGAAAVLTYVIVPAAPPWMASDAGVIEPIVRSPFLGWERIGLGIVEPVIEQGRAVANPVAALPSMHAGFALFIAAFFWPRVGTLARAALGAYAGAMAFTLVLTGEHWVADVLLGWAYVAVVMAGWAWWDRRAGPRPGDSELARSAPSESTPVVVPPSR